MLTSFFNKSASAPTTPDEPARRLPEGILEHDGQALHASPDLVALVVDGWELKQQIEALQKQLRTITDKLQNSLGAGTSLTVEGVCRATISSRQVFVLSDVHKCQAFLGGRFADLVDESVEYTLTNKLKEIVLDPDHPLSAGLRDCVLIKESTSVSFRAK